MRARSANSGVCCNVVIHMARESAAHYPTSTSSSQGGRSRGMVVHAPPGQCAGGKNHRVKACKTQRLRYIPNPRAVGASHHLARWHTFRNTRGGLDGAVGTAPVREKPAGFEASVVQARPQGSPSPDGPHLPSQTPCHASRKNFQQICVVSQRPPPPA